MLDGMADRPIDRLDAETKRIMERLVNAPPQPHKPPAPKKRGGAKVGASRRRKGSRGAA